MKRLHTLLMAGSIMILLYACSSHASQTASTEKTVCISDSMMKMIRIDTVQQHNIDDD